MGRRQDDAWIESHGVEVLWYMAIPLLERNIENDPVYYETDPYDRGMEYLLQEGDYTCQITQRKVGVSRDQGGASEEGDALLTYSHEYHFSTEDRIVVKDWDTRVTEIFQGKGTGANTIALGKRWVKELIYMKDEDGNVYNPVDDVTVDTAFEGDSTLTFSTSFPAAGKDFVLIYTHHPIFIIRETGMNRSFGKGNSNQLLRRAMMDVWDPRINS